MAPSRQRGPAAAVLALALALSLAGCAGGAPLGGSAPEAVREPTTATLEDFRDTDLGCGWEPTASLVLTHAKRFTVDSYEGGYRLACLADGSRYLVVPEGAEAPSGLAEDIVVLSQPIDDVYLAASDSFCLFEALDAVDRISVSGIERDGWHVDAARAAMDAGAIVYGGRYRTPDYELLLAREVRLAIESTMINHTPEVREKLVELGIPVLTELSSYEDEPLGRAEWVKLYGALLDREEEAARVFAAQEAELAGLAAAPTDRSVAYFYLNARGDPVVRRPGDYVTRMIEQAGGRYAFSDLPATELGASSITMQMEQFYAIAKDADLIIYNGSIDDSLDSVDELIGRNDLLAGCKAVQTGEVWATDQDMYQQMLQSGAIIRELNQVICGGTGELRFLRRLSAGDGA